MKRFEQLTNRDKGYNLHLLFPGEISAFLTYTQGTAKAIAAKQEQDFDQAIAKMFFGFEPKELKAMAYEAADVTESFFHLMSDNAEFFAEQLFASDLCDFVIDCLKQYSRICPNKKIGQYVTLFFTKDN